jgi:hypothetical protein
MIAQYLPIGYLRGKTEEDMRMLQIKDAEIMQIAIQQEINRAIRRVLV